jgi:tetratricopeptide (TPR) repeat protein
MPASLASERDRDILRSFARRIDPSDAGAHNNLGVLYYNKGMYEEAVSAFSQALELDPKMQVARRNLEVAYFNTGYYDRRVAELRERLRQQPADRDARWELGRAHSALGDAQEAVAEFRALLEYHPDDLGAIVQLGLAEKAGGNLATAQGWFERALTLDPDSPLVNFSLGEVLYNRGVNDEALAALHRAIELSPDNPDAHYLLGFVLGDLGRHEEAREATKRAIQLNPSLSRAQANLSLDRYNPATYEEMLPERQERREQKLMEVEGEGHLAHLNLGLAFRQKGYYAEALREYKMALERGAERALVLQAMAEVHLLTKDPVGALGIYDQVLQDQAASPKLWCERGVALHQTGRYAEAAESYRKALALDPASAIAHNNLGVACFHAGETDQAIQAFRSALDARGDFVKAWLNLALLLLQAKRHQRSLDAYRQVLALEPEQPVAGNGIGLVSGELKQFEEARNAFGRAIEARPGFAEAHYNLSFTLSNLGDFDGALRATKRALELDPFYVPQKFELAIDVEYEDPDLSVTPELGREQRVDGRVEDFSFDPTLLDPLFAGLERDEPAAAPSAAEERPYAMALDYLEKGLLDRAAAEISRVLARGASMSEGLTLLGDVYARQGLHGEALERYRAARGANGVVPPPRALAGETRALLVLGRPAEARPVAEQLLEADAANVEWLLLVAMARANSGDAAAARTLLHQARTLAPARADVLKQLGEVACAVGDIDGAIDAYRGALALDGGFAVVHYELARLLAERGDPRAAETELVAALDAVPTYVEATLELASVRRRLGSPHDALAPLVDLLRRDPYNIDALFVLAETLMQLERHDDVAIATGRILRFDPDHAGALYLQGSLLAAQHRYRDAISRWHRVVETNPESEYATLAQRDTRTAIELSGIFRVAEEV